MGIFPVERMIVSTAWQSEEIPATAPLLFVLESDPGAPSGEEGRREGGAELQPAAASSFRMSCSQLLSGPREGRLHRLGGDTSRVSLPEGMLRRFGELD